MQLTLSLPNCVSQESRADISLAKVLRNGNSSVFAIATALGRLGILKGAAVDMGFGFSGDGRNPGQQRPHSSFLRAEVGTEGVIIPAPSLGTRGFNSANEIFQPRALNLLLDVSFTNIFS